MYIKIKEAFFSNIYIFIYIYISPPGVGCSCGSTSALCVS